MAAEMKTNFVTRYLNTQRLWQKILSGGVNYTQRLLCLFRSPPVATKRGDFSSVGLHKTTQITDVQITNTVGTVTIQDVHVVVTGATHAEKKHTIHLDQRICHLYVVA